jgi:hypothetical protein
MSNNYNNNKSIIISSNKIDQYNYNIHYLLNNNNYYNCNIEKWKDQRLELIEIPKGLIEILQNTGFTIEKILDSEPSIIAEKLGIDPYIGEIIFRETNKAITKINPDLIFFNK